MTQLKGIHFFGGRFIKLLKSGKTLKILIMNEICVRNRIYRLSYGTLI